MFKFTSSVLALAFASVAVSQAMAADVSFSGFTHGSKTVTAKLSTLNGNLTKTVSAGGFSTVLNGGPSFESYCVDLYQTIAFGASPYHEYTLPNTTHVFANSHAYADLGRLYANAGPIGDALHEAAFQIAVWKTAYETTGAYDLAHSAATFVGGTAGSSGALTLAAGWLASLGSGSGRTVVVLESSAHQDVVIAVPEPSTYLLMFAGLFGVIFMARWRGWQANRLILPSRTA